MPALIADTPLAQLALELATGLFDAVQVFRNHGVSKDDAKALMHDPQFRSMLVGYRKLWHSPMNATERVRLKSAVAVEDGLLELHRLYHDVTLAPQARLDAFKQLVQLSDLAPRPTNAGSDGPRFSLTLNLGAPDAPRSLTIDTAALPESPADA
jgi:hypothetical protein